MCSPAAVSQALFATQRTLKPMRQTTMGNSNRGREQRTDKEQ